MRTMWFAGGFHHVAVKGRRALPTEAAILTLAPHSSYFDAIPVTMTMSSIVMKAESRDIPIWGTLIKYIRPVLVSRSDQDSRRKTVEEIKRRAQLGGRWPQIMIFPEGTCTNRTCLITFKPGAFIPGVPVQPVVLRYPNKLDTITWTWQGPGALEILWLTLCQLHNRVEIEFLPVYSPSEEERRSPALYASNVRRVMAKALGVPVTDYTFEDCRLALAEGQLRLPADTCLLEFAQLVRGLGLKPEKLEKDLDKYSESARMKRGDKIDLSEFAAYLEVPVSDVLEDMFSLFDERNAHQRCSPHRPRLPPQPPSLPGLLECAATPRHSRLIPACMGLGVGRDGDGAKGSRLTWNCAEPDLPVTVVLLPQNLGTLVRLSRCRVSARAPAAATELRVPWDVLREGHGTVYERRGLVYRDATGWPVRTLRDALCEGRAVFCVDSAGRAVEAQGRSVRAERGHSTAFARTRSQERLRRSILHELLPMSLCNFLFCFDFLPQCNSVAST
ncbi:lysophosphatidylcholine acyltransferase 1 isoform X3 [Choloepus didactylus]|nr:lysophosphatidylcholine acyltransferase 1 isoform X3 [Choloepus didactylus]